MKIEAVIFDLDGTLFDSIADIADANNAMLRSFGYPEHDIDKYIQWVGNGAMRLVKSSLPVDEAFDEESLEDLLKRYQDIYARNIAVKSMLFEGVDAVLDFLTENRIPMAINTNKPQRHTSLIVEQCFTRWRFDVVVAQVDGMPKKPDPAGALYIAERMHKKPENILYVGDSLVDMNTAGNAGMKPLGVAWGYGRVREGTVDRNIPVVSRPEEIIIFIKDHTGYE